MSMTESVRDFGIDTPYGEPVADEARPSPGTTLPDSLGTRVSVLPIGVVSDTPPAAPPVASPAAASDLETIRAGIPALEQAYGDRAVAQGDEANAVMQQKLAQAEGEAAARKAYAERGNQSLEVYTQKIAANPLPEFVPTKDSAQDMAGLFALVGIFGTMMSRGAGHGSAMGALASMSGMMDGWSKGRRDLYERERDEFGKNMTRVRQLYSTFDKELAHAQETAKGDLDAGVAEAKLAAAKVGSDIVKAQIDKFGYQGLIDARANINKLLTTTAQLETKITGAGADGVLTEATKQILAERLAAGDKSALTGLGLGKVGSVNRAGVLNKFQELAGERGMSGQDSARQMAVFGGLGQSFRTTGAQAAKVGYAVEALDRLVPLAVTASRAVDRTKYPTFNAAVLAVRRGTGDEAVVRFIAANQALVSDYAAVIARGNAVISDAARKAAEDVLATGYSEGQYEATTDQIMLEGREIRKAVKDQLNTAATDFGYAPQGGGMSQNAAPNEGGGIAAQATAAFGGYEPGKFDYRVNPTTGRLQRKARGSP